MKRRYGRNYIIERYHKESGLPYSVCRAKLKENNWDLRKVYGIDVSKLWKTLRESLDAFSKAIDDLGAALAQAINDTVDRLKFKTAKDITEESTYLLESGEE